MNPFLQTLKTISTFPGAMFAYLEDLEKRFVALESLGPDFAQLKADFLKLKADYDGLVASNAAAAKEAAAKK